MDFIESWEEADNELALDLITADDPSAKVLLLFVGLTDGMDTRLLWQYTYILNQFREHNPDGGTIINITALGGDFGMNSLLTEAQATTAATHGILKTAHHEWDNCRCICLDIQDIHSFDQFDALNHLCMSSESRQPLALEIGYKNKAWHQLELTAQLIQDLPIDKTPRLNSEDLVVVTGGARGVTSEVALKLAEAYQCELVLLGRSPLPAADAEELSHPALAQAQNEMELKQALIQLHANQKLSPRQLMDQTARILSAREIHSTLNRIRQAGIQAHYFSCDVTDAKSMSDTISEIQDITGKSVSGIVHGAGVLADRLITDKTREQLERVYHTKVHGLNHLIQAIDIQQLKAAVLFSSSTGRFGRKGQMDYAAGNEVLNKTARWLNSTNPDCKIVSVNWGPWDGGMVTSELKALFANEGVGVIPVHQGARYLVHEIQSSPDNKPVEVVIIGRTESQQLDYTPEKIRRTSCDQTLTFDVNPDRLPSLTDHVIGGKAALPAANMICWMMAACRSRIQNFKVLKGVHFEDAKSHQRLQLKIDDGRILLSGRFPHAAATIALDQSDNTIRSNGDGNNPLPAIQFHSPVPGVQSKGAVYQPGILFHGKLLQGIRKVTHLDASGICVIASPKNWESTHFNLSPEEVNEVQSGINGNATALFLDCAFQAAILWCQDQKDMGSLPTGFDSLNIHQPFPTFNKAMVEIKCQVLEVKTHELVMHIEFINSENELIARMTRYTCVMNESLQTAFRDNRLSKS